MRRLPLMAACIAAMHLPATAAAFVHPGVVVGRGQLEFVRGRIQAGAQPWKTAFDRMKASPQASLSWKPSPRASVDCGAYSSPNNGCSEERDDAVAAYAHALQWSFTGKEEHARKAMEILDAWSKVLKTHTNHNAPLQSGWAASVSVRAAEIIRHGYGRWPEADAVRFGAMLRNAYLPYLLADIQHYNGNWLLTMQDAALGIAVYLEDRPLFDEAVARWRKRVPAYFYIAEDGPRPVAPPASANGSPSGKSLEEYWYGQTVMADGLSQETCRDLGHMGYGLASMFTAAETALLQGVDLYAEQPRRMAAAMEFHADYLLGKAVPSWLCKGSLDKVLGPTWEIGYNHLVNRRGMGLPLTKRLIESRLRPTGVDHHMAWETLTHAETGTAGLGASIPAPRKVHGPASGIRLRFTGAGQFEVLLPGASPGGMRRYRLDGARPSGIR